MNVLHTIGTVSLCLYGLLGVACIISFFLSFRTNKKRKGGDGEEVDPAEVRLQQFYHLFLGLFVAVRITWVTLHTFYGSTITSFILKRCGFVLFFTAFTIVLFYWAELYHKNYIVAKGFLPRLVNGFVATNALLYVSEIGVVMTFLIADRGHYDKREGNPIYDSSVYLEIFVSFVVSIAFLIYGMRLFMQHSRASDFEENYTRKAKEILTILVATLIFTACFIVRVVAFLYRPITNNYMNQELFQVLAYYIPEVIPSLVQFYLIGRRLHKEKKDTQFIHDLYQQEEEVLRDDMRMHYTNSSTAVVTPTGTGLGKSGDMEKINTEKSQLLPRP